MNLKRRDYEKTYYKKKKLKDMKHAGIYEEFSLFGLLIKVS